MRFAIKKHSDQVMFVKLYDLFVDLIVFICEYA